MRSRFFKIITIKKVFLFITVIVLLSTVSTLLTFNNGHLDYDGLRKRVERNEFPLVSIDNSVSKSTKEITFHIHHNLPFVFVPGTLTLFETDGELYRGRKPDSFSTDGINTIFAGKTKNCFTLKIPYTPDDTQSYYMNLGFLFFAYDRIYPFWPTNGKFPVIKYSDIEVQLHSNPFLNKTELTLKPIR